MMSDCFTSLGKKILCLVLAVWKQIGCRITDYLGSALLSAILHDSGGVSWAPLIYSRQYWCAGFGCYCLVVSLFTKEGMCQGCNMPNNMENGNFSFPCSKFRADPHGMQTHSWQKCVFGRNRGASCQSGVKCLCFTVDALFTFWSQHHGLQWEIFS